MNTNLTQEQLALVAEKTGIEISEIPYGQLHTSGPALEGVTEQTQEAIENGVLSEGVKVIAVIDRDVTGIAEDGDVEGLDFTAVLTDSRGYVGLADGRGISWFSKGQVESLKQIIATR